MNGVRRLIRGARVWIVAEGVDERTGPTALAVGRADAIEEFLRCVARRGGVEHGDAVAVEQVVAPREECRVVLRRAAPVGRRVRLIPNDDGRCVRDSVERTPCVRAEAPLRTGGQ